MRLEFDNDVIRSVHTARQLEVLVRESEDREADDLISDLWMELPTGNDAMLSESSRLQAPIHFLFSTPSSGSKEVVRCLDSYMALHGTENLFLLLFSTLS